MIATWSIRDASGATVASGTVRLETPADLEGAQESALRVASAVEHALIDNLGAGAEVLPLLRAIG